MKNSHWFGLSSRTKDKIGQQQQQQQQHFGLNKYFIPNWLTDLGQEVVDKGQNRTTTAATLTTTATTFWSGFHQALVASWTSCESIALLPQTSTTALRATTTVTRAHRSGRAHWRPKKSSPMTYEATATATTTATRAHPTTTTTKEEEEGIISYETKITSAQALNVTTYLQICGSLFSSLFEWDSKWFEN